MYNFDWHKDHGTKTTSSAKTIVDILVSFLDIDSVLDIGCGDGRWLSECRGRGANTIAGVDGPWTDPANLLIPTECLTIQELSQRFDLRRRYSLAICLEVAEHVDEQFSDVFVDNLIRHSDVILFGAAIPYQGGFRHINEQWQSYWAKLFEDRGFAAFDPLRSQLWDDPNVHFWYKQNTILYVNRQNDAILERVSRYIADQVVRQLPLDIVHPEKYEAAASYKTVSFRPLIRRLPEQIVRKLADIMLRKT